jgi:hypothetical protein
VDLELAGMKQRLHLLGNGVATNVILSVEEVVCIKAQSRTSGVQAGIGNKTQKAKSEIKLRKQVLGQWCHQVFDQTRN